MCAFYYLSNYLYYICESLLYLRNSIVFVVKVSPKVKEQKNFLFSTFGGTCSRLFELFRWFHFVYSSSLFFAKKEFFRLKLIVFVTNSLIPHPKYNNIILMWDKKKLLRGICWALLSLLLDWSLDHIWFA